MRSSYDKWEKMDLSDDEDDGLEDQVDYKSMSDVWISQHPLGIELIRYVPGFGVTPPQLVYGLGPSDLSNSEQRLLVSLWCPFKEQKTFMVESTDPNLELAINSLAGNLREECTLDVLLDTAWQFGVQRMNPHFPHSESQPRKRTKLNPLLNISQLDLYKDKDKNDNKDTSLPSPSENTWICTNCSFPNCLEIENCVFCLDCRQMDSVIPMPLSRLNSTLNKTLEMKYQANTHFKARRFLDALELYIRARDVLKAETMNITTNKINLRNPESKIDWNIIEQYPHAPFSRILQLQKDITNNCAAAALKCEKWKQALTFSSIVLNENDLFDVKARIRRSQAYKAIGKLQEAVDDLLFLKGKPDLLNESQSSEIETYLAEMR